MITGFAASPGSPQFPPVFFFFVFALSQFRGPDHLGAQNRLLSPGLKQPSFLERQLFLYDNQLSAASELPQQVAVKTMNNNLYFLLQNHCASNPCPLNGRCQTGFTDKGYRCVCPVGFTGQNCSKGIFYSILPHMKRVGMLVGNFELTP